MPETERQLLAFLLAGEEYAVPVDGVREVVAYEDPRHVPTPAPWLLGVISLRGELVPVCDLAARLGLPARPAAERQIVVVEGKGGAAGIVVGGVSGIVAFAGALRELPVGDDKLLAGLAEVESRLILALDLTVLLTEVGALRRKPPTRRRKTPP